MAMNLRQKWHQDAQRLDDIQYALIPQDGIPGITQITIRLRRGEFSWARSIYYDVVPNIKDSNLRQCLESIFGCTRHGQLHCHLCGLLVAENILELRRRLHLGP